MNESIDSTLSSWRLIEASVRGQAHEATGMPCQDFSESAMLGRDHALLVVSDGAGSARFSDKGSKIACETVLRVLSERVEERREGYRLSDLSDALIEAHKAVVEQAESQGLKPREFACTMIALIVDRSRGLCAHIGDGAIVIELEDGSYVAMSLPEKGEYANETSFLIDKNFLDEIRLRELQFPAPVKGAAIFSDGIERFTLDLKTGQPYAPFFGPMLNHARTSSNPDNLKAELIDYLNSTPVKARSDDDKSLAMAVFLDTSSLLQPQNPESATAVPSSTSIHADSLGNKESRVFENIEKQTCWWQNSILNRMLDIFRKFILSN